MTEKQNAEMLANEIEQRHGDDHNGNRSYLFTREQRDLIVTALRAAAPSPHPRGEPVAWQWWSGIHLIEMTSAKSKADKWIADGNDVRALYAAPPPAGADAVREAAIEECAKVFYRLGSNDMINAFEAHLMVRSLLPAPQPQEKPGAAVTDDQGDK